MVLVEKIFDLAFMPAMNSECGHPWLFEGTWLRDQVCWVCLTVSFENVTSIPFLRTSFEAY